MYILNAQATFTAENSVVLTGVSESAQFTTTGGRSGIYPTSFFTNTAAGSQFVSSSGQWLAEPQVTRLAYPSEISEDEHIRAIQPPLGPYQTLIEVPTTCVVQHRT